MAPLGALLILLAHRTHPVVPLAAAAALGALALAYYRPLAAVMVALALVPLEGFTIPFAGGGVNPLELMFVLTGGVWAVRRVLEGQPPWAASPLSLPLAALLLAAGPGLAVAVEPALVVRFLIFWVAFLLVFWLLVAEADAASMRSILFTIALSGALLSATTALGSAGQQELSATGGVAQGRAEGVFGPNILASILALSFPAALFVAFGPERRRRVPAALAAGLIFVGLVLTLSRAGLMAGTAGMLVMLAWSPLRRFGLIAAVVLVAVIPFASNQLGQVEQFNVVVKRIESIRYSTSSRTDQRTTIYSETPQMISDFWATGVGAGNYPGVAPRYGIIDPYSRNTFEHAHNLVLNVGAELGVPGLIALAWLLFALARLMLQAFRSAPSHRGAALVAVAALVGFGIQGIFDFVLRSNAPAGFLFVMLGALAVLARPPQEPGGVAATA